ncbi:hypothetical protein CQR47_0009 [Bifidobacterium thermophilum]|uniref:Uncharacterized protein n=1 Tax=Bifidobacterium thermophilum TaxID=33905 RepID=A0A2N3QPU8_9BIFI|nr:hypothetical protein CQR47_0009 [Bifidobacterium thermophilum]
MRIRFSPDACPPYPPGGCMISTDGSAFSRICAGLLATCAIQAIISHQADSSRIGISTISLAQYRRTRPSQPNSREITTTPRVRPKLPGDLRRPHKSIQNSRALAPISNCRKSKRPSRGTISTRRARFQTGTMPIQQLHERNQAPSRSSICGTDFLPNSMVCCAPAPCRVMTMHGTLITLNLSLSSGKCAIS